MTEKTEQLKVGWVYKDGHNEEFLIVLSNFERDVCREDSWVGIKLTPVDCINVHCYKKNGEYFSGHPLDALILSTGKKWEPKND